MGFKFLKHVSRTQCLLFIIDASDTNYLTAYETLSQEIESYSKELAKKPRMVLCNKIDIEGAKENADEIASKIKAADKDITVLSVSVLNNIGMAALRNALIQLVDKLENNQAPQGQTPAPSVSSFMAERESIDDDAEIQYPGSEG